MVDLFLALTRLCYSTKLVSARFNIEQKADLWSTNTSLHYKYTPVSLQIGKCGIF